MRKIALTQSEILQKLEELKRNDIEQDKKIELIFDYLNQFEKVKQEELEFKNRPRIGFKPQ
jgi:hypothetical protein